MNLKTTNPNFLGGILLIGLSLVYFIFPYKNIVNADEYSYLMRGFQIFGLFEEYSLEACHQYMVGWPVIIGLFYKVFGGISFLPLLVFVAGQLSFWYLLKREGRDPLWTLFGLLNVPLLLFGRLLMSDSVSFLSIVLFLLLYKDNLDKYFKQFALALVFVLSVYIRETNVIVLLPLLLFQSISKPLRWKLFVGICILLFYLLFSSINKTIYAETNTIRPLYSLFQASNFLENILLILFSLLILLPGALYLYVKNKSVLKREFNIPILLYLVTFCVYDYNGLGYSGSIALLTYPRYFLPLIPLLILVISEGKKFQYPKISSAVVLILFTAISYTHNVVAEDYNKIGMQIVDKTPIVLSKNYNEAVKVANPFTTLKFVMKDSNGNVPYNLKIERKISLNENIKCATPVEEFETYLSQYILCKQ